MMEWLYWGLVISTTLIGFVMTLFCGYCIAYNIKHKHPHPLFAPVIEHWYENYHVRFCIVVIMLAVFMIWLKDYISA